MVKTCSRCRTEKPLELFGKCRSSRDGRNWYCLECARIRSREWTASNPESARRAKATYRDANVDVIRERNRDYANRKYAADRSSIITQREQMWKNARNRAKQKGLSFDIELADIVIPERCPILDKPLEWGHKKPTPFSASLDRIDPSKGYVKGNVHVISFRANAIKNDASPEELRTVADFMEGYVGNAGFAYLADSQG